LTHVNSWGAGDRNPRKEERGKSKGERVGIPEKISGFPLRSTPKKRDLRYATTGRDQGLNYRA